MLNVTDVTIEFGDFALFKNISFQLNKNEIVGLIGKNGAGKSTLLKLITKESSPTSGAINFQKGIKIGLLRQDINIDETQTVKDFVQTAFDELKSIEVELRSIEKYMETVTDFESEEYLQKIDRYSDINERYEMLGGYKMDAETEKILLGLGFEPEKFDVKLSEFSGGWKMRALLSKLLLEQNEILLLDEPTNHLDLNSIIWLENYLKEYAGAVLMVSHDKLFLDRCTNRTIEIANKKIYDYPFNYSKFVEVKKELLITQRAAKENQEKEMKKMGDLVNKFRAKASKASFAQSLIKKMDKMEVIELDDEDNAAMNVKFNVSKEPGKIIVHSEEMSFSYFEGQNLLNNVSYYINRGDKLAFVGANGMGKSTMVKLLKGELEANKGSIDLGHNVELGYYAQEHHEDLDFKDTVLESVLHVATPEKRPQVRSVLGAFLFSDDSVDKKISVLSGGERARVALARLLVQPSNFLILDEPTNHLDLYSKQRLKEALLEYKGTFIVVSHDRDFLKGLTEKVMEFKRGEVKEFLGDIDEYLKNQNLSLPQDLELKDKVSNKKSGSKKDKEEESESVLSLEIKIERVEKQIKEFELKKEKSSGNKTLKLAENIKDKRTELEALYSQLEELI